MLGMIILGKLPEEGYRRRPEGFALNNVPGRAAGPGVRMSMVRKAPFRLRSAGSSPWPPRWVSAASSIRPSCPSWPRAG